MTCATVEDAEAYKRAVNAATAYRRVSDGAVFFVEVPIGAFSNTSVGLRVLGGPETLFTTAERFAAEFVEDGKCGDHAPKEPADPVCTVCGEGVACPELCCARYDDAGRARHEICARSRIAAPPHMAPVDPQALLDATLRRLRAEGHDVDELVRRATENLRYWRENPAPWPSPEEPSR